MTDIHPTAIVAGGARLGSKIRIGAFTTIGPDVTLDDGVVVDSHVVIEGRTRIGAGTRVHSFAAIGGTPQDLSYRDEPTAVEIGTNGVIREHVTIHRGTGRGRQVTTIGDNCFLMVGVHVAHDCEIGKHVIMVNNAGLSGHVTIGDHAILSGYSGIQQHGRVGAHAFIGAHTVVVTDVIPFASAIGHRAELGGLNIIGLKRRGFDRPAIHGLRAAYQAIFNGGGTLAERVDMVADKYADVPAVMTIVDFIRAGGDRPLCTPRD